MTKKALVSGITGQDGSYLAELLLGKGYEVYGIIRRSSSFNTKRIEHIYHDPKLKLEYGDLTDATRLRELVLDIRPDEVYNLGKIFNNLPFPSYSPRYKRGAGGESFLLFSTHTQKSNRNG